MTTYKDIYPTGRKHCSCCKRWRYLVDFRARAWADETKTEARSLSSLCGRCQAAKMREKTGCKPRNWYPHGAPNSERYRAHRLETNAKSHARRMQDPEYAELYYEYHRIYYHGTQGSGRHIQPSVLEAEGEINLDPGPFVEWVDAFHPALEPKETAYVSELRRGRRLSVTMSFVDEVMTRNGCMVDMLRIYMPQEELSDAA